ncbi:MAG: LysR family transcriptional regulator [Alphaproteobacteria bacterium]|jgi:DNA-binding transcriptional LysR family regulator|uniref:LysR family transcriptional regulator n=1 Tax=Pacificispira sp. TaxID=2888761 RepID=UPI001B172C1F|nr:LysR family transcriptional regulator [Alphaproteobacteria bacterium]MBO6861192.1 LysR family transcriptional regulator [Alphaproteobacteria bacterium]MEC9265284.1 LysR family transcriptional regulator [Pseudomonadota bacterium]
MSDQIPKFVRRLQVDDLRTIQIFASVVESQSFSRTARVLGITPSTVSKHISQLEERLETQLVNRTTRRISISNNGMSFYYRCVAILREMEAAEEEIFQLTQEPMGVLRVTAPTGLASRHISPRLSEFMEKYPKIDLDFILTSQTLDMVQDGIDLSIRIASSTEPGMRAELLAPNRRVICASPAYLEKHGIPKTPEDLEDHNCLVSRTMGLLNVWPVKASDGTTRQIKVSGSMITNHVEMIRDALLGDRGIALIGTFVVGEDLKAGRLIPILREYVVQNTAFYAVVPHSRHIQRKTRVFIDFVREAFGPTPYWDEMPPNSAMTG